MKKTTVAWALAFAVSAFLISSCGKNSDAFSEEDTETSNNEATQESTTSELDDIATSVLDNSPDSGNPLGRTAVADDRFSCDGTTVTFSDVNATKTEGKVVISFGPNGCTDRKGNVRKGSIIIAWKGGRWYNVNSSTTITLDGYSINDVQLSGTRTTTCKTFTQNPLSITWTVTANHTALWPDGTKATRTINKTRRWDHTASEDKYTISNGPNTINSAEGKNRNGREYKVHITTPLVYLASCAKISKVFIPVTGEKAMTFISSTGKTKSLVVNYGDGACDNIYTVTSGSVTKELTCKNDDH